MGLFSKIKSMFKGESKPQEQEKIETKKEEQTIEEENHSVTEIKQEETSIEQKKQEVSSKEEKKKELESNKEQVPSTEPTKKVNKVYEKGLTKSRKSFVSNLMNLTSKYRRVNEEYFEELEEILIMADIGVNTVMEFMDRLRSRVQK